MSRFMTYYDRKGELIAPDGTDVERMMTAGKLFIDPQYKIVALTIMHFKTGPVRVSTIWLGGIDHDFMYRGPIPNPAPVIFETMVFDESHEPGDGEWAWDDYCRRWRSEAEAVAGHNEIVNQLSVMYKPLKIEIEQFSELQ